SRLRQRHRNRPQQCVFTPFDFVWRAGIFAGRGQHADRRARHIEVALSPGAVTMIGESSTRRRRIFAWGTAWGIALNGVEQLAFTPGEAWATVSMLLWWLTMWMTPVWCLVGCMFVWVADRAVRQHGIRGSLLGWLTVAVIAAIGQPFLSIRVQTWVREFL